MIYHITRQQQKAKAPAYPKPKKYFTLARTLVYFPTTKVVSSKRADVLYDTTESLVSFQPKKDGQCCITRSQGRAHIGISKSNGLDLLRNRMPKGTYIPIKWKDVPSHFAAKSSRRDRIFKHDPSFSIGSSSSTKKFKKKKRVSKSTRRNISRSLKAHHRGRKKALKK